MNTFSTDLIAIEAEIRALPITLEPLPTTREGEMSPVDQELSSELFFELQQGSRKAIREVKKLIQKYPDVPALKNHLTVAYHATGRHRAARAVNEQLRKENPGYLFGHLNHASAFLEPGKVERIPGLIGETLRLGDFQPDTELFHSSEIKGYYNIVAHFHLHSARPQVARAIHGVLVDIVGSEDSALKQLGDAIRQQNVQRLRSLMDEEDARAIRVTPKDEPAGNPAADDTLPSLIHAPVKELYRHHFGMPRELVDEILAFPKDSLVADLLTVLENAYDRVGYDLANSYDLDGGEGYFVLHALFFLGELGAGDALDKVFESLSENLEVLELWFGDFIDVDLWEPIYRLVEGQLPAATPFMLGAGVTARARELVAEAVTQVGLHQPGRRGEVVAWFEHVIESLLASPPEDNVIDTMLVTTLVDSLMTLRATELLPLIQRLWDKGYVMESIVGDMEIISAEMAMPPSESEKMLLRGLRQFYRDTMAPPPPRSGDDPFRLFDDDEDLFSAPALPAPKPEAGRNDPCPCGSGKKFKKCCL